MKSIILPAIIAILLSFQSGIVFGEDNYTHSAYRVTSYDLGSLKGFANRGMSPISDNSSPLFITEATADALSSEEQITVSLGDTEPDILGISSIALSAQFNATDKISIQGSFGVTRNLWTPDLADSLNGSSWEANLGIIYKLLNNLSYELHFGYMDTGDLFIDQSSYSDVENIIMINNKLSLSF